MKSWPMTLLYVLLAILGLSLIWRADFSGRGIPEWQRCKESLFEQVVFNNCTLIFKGDERPA